MRPSNILHIENLDYGHRDNDEVMLHACFQILCNSIEEDEAFERDDCWEIDPEYIAAKYELECLYDWWQERRYVEFISYEDTKQYIEDSRMLAVLLNLRRFLCTV